MKRCINMEMKIEIIRRYSQHFGKQLRRKGKEKGKKGEKEGRKEKGKEKKKEEMNSFICKSTGWSPKALPIQISSHPPSFNLQT